MIRFVKSPVLLLFFFISVLTYLKAEENIKIVFQKSLEQQTNILVEQISLDQQNDQQQYESNTVGIYIRIQLDLIDQTASSSSPSNQEGNRESLSADQQFTDDCELLNCQSDEVYLAVIFGFNETEFTTIYNQFDTNNSPLQRYQNRTDYSAFLRQKKSHEILIPTSIIGKNIKQLSIGVLNLASKVKSSIGIESVVSFRYNLTVSEVISDNQTCFISCIQGQGTCNNITQQCQCSQHYFDTDCSLQAESFLNQLLLTKQPLSSTSYYVSQDQINSKTFNQTIQSIQPDQWVYYYWDIDSSEFPSVSQSDPKSSPKSIQEYSIIFTFEKSLFNQLSLSYIFYGQDRVFIPNIFMNYSKIINLPEQSAISNKNTQSSPQTDSQRDNPPQYVQLVITYAQLKQYVEMYREQNLIETLFIDTTLIIGFKNDDTLIFPGSTSYTMTIQYTNETDSISESASKVNQSQVSNDLQESSIQDSHIIIISCISVVFLIAVVLFLLRKRICPKRYLKHTNSELNLHKKSNSNVSIAADSLSRRKLDNSTHKLHASSSFNKQLFQSNFLNQKNNSLNIQQSQPFMNLTQQQQHSCQSRSRVSSRQCLHKESIIKSKQGNQGFSFNEEPQNNNNNNNQIKTSRQQNNGCSFCTTGQFSLPVTACTCNSNQAFNQKCATSQGQTLANIQSSYHKFIGDKSQLNIQKSNINLEEIILESDIKQQMQGTATKRLQDQTAIRSLSHINGCQTFNQINQMTTQSNSERRSYQADLNFIGNTLANIDYECENCLNRRKMSKADSGSQQVKKSTLQPLEVLEEDELAIMSHEDSINPQKLQKADVPPSALPAQDVKQNIKADDKHNYQLFVTKQSSKQESEGNVSPIYKCSPFTKTNINQNNNLFEQYILYGPDVFKNKWRKNLHKSRVKKTKQRINYKLNKNKQKKKYKLKKIRQIDEFEKENVSIYLPKKKAALFQKNNNRNNSFTSSKFSQIYLRDSNSSKIMSSGKSIRKKQNTPRGVISHFFYTHRHPNSSNTIRQMDQKPCSFELDISSIQKKVKLAESIFTGINPSCNNLSIDGREIKSFQQGTDTTDAKDQNLRNGLIQTQNSPVTYSPNSIFPSQSKRKQIYLTQNNIDENICTSEQKSPMSMFNYGNNLVNTFLPKGSQTPQNIISFGNSPQFQSFGLQPLNFADMPAIKLGENNESDNNNNRLVALDQGSKGGILLPSYIMQTSKKSEDLSTPGFLKTRHQGSNSKPSAFFHSKFYNSPQRSQNYDDQEEEEGKENNKIQQKSPKKKVISPFLHAEDIYLNSSQYKHKSLFDLNSSSNKERENQPIEYNNSNLDGTMIKNSSTEEGIHHNPTFRRKSFNLKNVFTPTKSDKPIRIDEIMMTSSHNESAHVNRIFYDNESGFHLRKIKSLNNYDNPRKQSSQIQRRNSRTESKQDLQSQNYTPNSSNQLKDIEKQTHQQQQQQQPNSMTLFCQNGFLFTNLNRNKVNWDNMSKMNPFSSSMSEISQNNITHISNNIYDQDDKYAQSSQQFD